MFNSTLKYPAYPKIMPFGEALIKARENAGLKQKELAALIKNKDGDPISPAYLSDLERDLRKPSDYLIDQFASVLKTSAYYLYHCAGKLPPSFGRYSIDYEQMNQIEKLYQDFEKSLKRLSVISLILVFGSLCFVIK